MKNNLILVSLLMMALSGSAQTDTIFNPKALEKIPYYEQLYRFRVWRDVNFDEKQNAVFVSPNSNLKKFIIESVKAKKLNAYAPDDYTFDTPLSGLANGKAAQLPMFKPNTDYSENDEIIYGDNKYVPRMALVYVREPSDDNYWKLEKKKVPAAQPFDPNKSYSERDQVQYNGNKYTATQEMNGVPLPTVLGDFWKENGTVTNYVEESDIGSLQVVEDVIFDRRRSRLYYDIIGLKIISKEEGSPYAIINYKEFADLVGKLSHDREMRVRNTVKWKNRYNPSQDMNFADAFKLRLFHGIISQVENPDDKTIEEIYVTGNKRTYAEAIFARWEEEMKMMEKEHNLWEY
ncbi:MAG: hypothetical protein IM574_10155 [Cytophagales bacterium]|nr:hypothetical protein [Cytophagales bacterium]